MKAGVHAEPISSEIIPLVINRDADTEAGERDLSLTLNAAYMHSTTNSNGAYVDLKSQNIREIPSYFCEIFKNVQYLYLERNIIEELPDNFFPSLPYLKWLDVRNNRLHSIPTSIANHPTLETLLLEDNRIEKLPVELGLVPRLRGMQLKGNPITYPPQEIIAKGLQAMLTFLRSEMETKTPTDIQPVSELFYQNTKPFDAEEKKLSRKFQSKSCTNNSLRPKKSFQFPSHILALKSSQMSCVGNKKPLFSNNKVRPKFLNQTSSMCDEFPSSFNETRLPDGDCFTTEEKLLFPLRQKPSAYEIKMINREEKIQENFMKEMWICKLREMLEQQGKIIQRRKDLEILNGWRMDYRKSQSIPKFVKHNFSAPYDFNSDLCVDGSEKPQPPKREEKPREIGDEMAEIYRSLQCLSASKLEDSLSPKSKQILLDKELQQLGKLQKQLAMVQKRNAIEYQTLKDTKRPHARKSAPNLKFSN